MAQMFPSFEKIHKLRPTPTAGEHFLLEHLYNSLDESYEIYYQPHVYGMYPDIVVLRPQHGMLIIEVKDWDLNHYNIDTENSEWTVYATNITEYVEIRSPSEQVNHYKNMFYSLYSPLLAEASAVDWKNAKNIISTAIFFYNGDSAKSKIQLIKSILQWDGAPLIFTKSELMKTNFVNHVLRKANLNKKNVNPCFSEDLLKEFRRILQPPQHFAEQGIPIKYDSKQKEVINSKANIKQKIKGIPGCGKTKVLAKRAVNAYLRTRKQVLILTFNITLRNYIHDMISEVRENFSWKNFIITHYHAFVSNYNNKNGIKKEQTKDLTEKYILKEIPNKYDVILVDEIQDFEEAWIDSIHRLLKENGELIFFGDAKQNIYTRKMGQDKLPNTKIPGRWREFTQSYRMNNKISKIVWAFQKIYLGNKYELEAVANQARISQKRDNSIIIYYRCKHFSPSFIIETLSKIEKKYNMHDEDICCMSSRINLLQEVDYYYRKQKNLPTELSFEKKEIYDKINNMSISKKQKEIKIYNIRQARKYNFWMGSGKLKLATIHSFKGWEIKNVFLIINKADNPEENGKAELIYTGISRAKNSLVVFSIDNDYYEDFFRNNNIDIQIYK